MAAQSPSFSDFTKTLKGTLGEWKNLDENRITVAFGNCDFLLHKCAESFKSVFSKIEDVHYGSFEGSALDQEKFQTLWQSQGMFEPASSYIIRRADKTKQLGKFLTAISSCDDVQNKILFSFNLPKVPVKIKKDLDRLNAIYIPCFKATTKDIPGFINSLCKKHKLNVSPQGQGFLQHCLGEDLFRIENEILKLSLIFSEHSKTIESDDIALYLGVLREDHAFKLTNLLIDKKFSDAQVLASSLIKKGESAIAIIGILSRHIRNAIRIGDALRSGGQPGNLAGKLRLPNFVIRSYNQYVKGLNLQEMSSVLAMCQSADLKLKTSKCSYDDLIIGEIIAAVHRC